MVKTRIISAVLFSLVAVSSGAQGFDMAWGRVLMDGSRTRGKVLKGSAAKEAGIIREYAPHFSALNEVIGCSDDEMYVDRPQSPLGNWVADALLVLGSELCGESCDMSLINVWGLRESMPKGDVRVADIRAICPFNNKLAVLKIRGSEILKLFTAMAARRWEAFGGVSVKVRGIEPVEVLVDGKALEADKLYNVVSIDFLLDGGDNIALRQISEQCNVYDVVIGDAVISYIRSLSAEGRHICGGLDRRIVFVDRPHIASLAKSLPSQQSSGREISRQRARLTILHTNDTHSRIDPIRIGDGVGCGGVVERAAFIDSVRRADGRRNVLLLDAGDYCQGTPYFTLFHGVAEARTMNAMKYDVATVGNHEWDNGSDAFLSLLKKEKFRTVLCNYSFADSRLQKKLLPYTIVRRGGLKIGIIGVLADISFVTKRESTVGVIYHDPVEPVNKWAAYLKKEKKCDMVILLSHCGLYENHDGCRGDLDMVPYLHGVDLIIGGHTHDDLHAPAYALDADGNRITVVTDYCFGIYVGELKVF